MNWCTGRATIQRVKARVDFGSSQHYTEQSSCGPANGQREWRYAFVGDDLHLQFANDMFVYVVERTNDLEERLIQNFSQILFVEVRNAEGENLRLQALEEEGAGEPMTFIPAYSIDQVEAGDLTCQAYIIFGGNPDDMVLASVGASAFASVTLQGPFWRIEVTK